MVRPSRSASISILVAQTHHISQGADGCINSSSGSVTTLLCFKCSSPTRVEIHTLCLSLRERREPTRKTVHVGGAKPVSVFMKVSGLCKKTSTVLEVSTVPENKQLPERSEVHAGSQLLTTGEFE